MPRQQQGQNVLEEQYLSPPPPGKRREGGAIRHPDTSLVLRVTRSDFGTRQRPGSPILDNLAGRSSAVVVRSLGQEFGSKCSAVACMQPYMCRVPAAGARL